MKPIPGDPTCTVLDADACTEAELDIADCLSSNRALEDAPVRIFRHLLECPLCLETALASMEGLIDVDSLFCRLHRERDALGHSWPEHASPRRSH